MKNVNFSDFKLSEDLLKAIGMLSYESPTQVQAQVIPVLLGKRDVIVKSQTGERVIIVMGAINALESRISGTFIKNNSCIA